MISWAKRRITRQGWSRVLWTDHLFGETPNTAVGTTALPLPLHLKKAGEDGFLDFPQERERHGHRHQRQE
jgi:hypothetical protein